MEKNQRSENENCSICLSKNKIFAEIDSCVHKFCFRCVKKWSKIENSCPICKERFNKITKIRRGKGEKDVVLKK